MKKIVITIISFVLLVAILESCRHPKDCRGRRKRAKTDMGGWL